VGLVLWILKISAKKDCFLSFEWEKKISPLLPPPRKILEKSPSSHAWKKSFRRPCPQHNSLKSRITPKLATVFRCLIYKHSTFLRHKVIRALPNATVLCTLYCNGHDHTQTFAMFIITFKTIYNQNVGYHFCQEIFVLFWLRQKMVPYTVRNTHEYFYQKLSRP